MRLPALELELSRACCRRPSSDCSGLAIGDEVDLRADDHLQRIVHHDERDRRRLVGGLGLGRRADLASSPAPAAASNGRVIFGDVPGGSDPFGSSASHRANAACAGFSLPSAASTMPVSL